MIPWANAVKFLAGALAASAFSIMRRYWKEAKTLDMGEAVRSYRIKHGLTMEEFAIRAKVSKGYISMIEHGGHPRNGKPIKPKLETCINIARVLGVEVSDLFPDSTVDDSPKKPKEEKFDPVSALLDAKDVRAVVRKHFKDATPKKIAIAKEQLKMLIKVLTIPLEKERRRKSEAQ